MQEDSPGRARCIRIDEQENEALLGLRILRNVVDTYVLIKSTAQQTQQRSFVTHDVNKRCAARRDLKAINSITGSLLLAERILASSVTEMKLSITIGEGTGERFWIAKFVSASGGLRREQK